MVRLLSLCFFLCLLGQTGFSQVSTQAKLQRQKYEEKIQEKRNTLIQDFLDDLDVDDFQKEIIEQKLHSYIQKKEALYREGNKSYVLKEKIEVLDSTHFQDIATMLSSETMAQIKDFISLKEDPTKSKSKKRKNKKRDSEGKSL